MSATFPCTHKAHQQRHRRFSSASLHNVVALIGAIGIGLFMVGAVFALNSYQAFHTTGEQVDLGIAVSGDYTDTSTANGTYRVLREDYVSGEARTQADNPADFSIRATYTDVMNFSPYTMPAEGGFIHRVGIYIFEAGAGDTQFRLALYQDTEDVPRVLLAQSEPLTATTAGWLWFDIEPQSVPGSTRYWLAYQATDDDAKLGWMGFSPSPEGYRYSSWHWGPFPTLAGRTWGPIYFRTCYQIAYTATQYALDVAYPIPVTPTLDAYTLTVRGATSGEPFSITADGQAVGSITYSPTTRDFFSDDMESGVGEWIADEFTHIVTDSSHYSSPTHVWWTDDVPYPNSASLTSIPITLPFNARDLELRFWHRMVSGFESDGGWIEYRVQNPDTTWSTWSLLTDTMFLQGAYRNRLLNVPSGVHWAWTGQISDTVRVQVPMTAAGRSIQWRWTFECDPGGQGPSQPDGWWIDDVYVLGKASDDTELVFSLPAHLMDDSQVTVRFQDTITNSYPDLLGINLIEITGVLYNRPPIITLTAPNGGEYWAGTQTVEWTGSDPNRDVVTYNVYLSTNGGVTWTTSLYQVSFSETEAPVTHSWNGFDTTAFSDSDNCLISIQTSDGDAGASDESDAVFTIDNTTPSVTLTAPNGSEILRGGASYTITWDASDANFGSLPIAIYYSTDGGFSFPSAITTATQNDGSFTWTIPELDNAHVQVRVVATDLAGHSSHDDSDADFAIDNTAPSVILTAPNGSEILQGGASYAITWNASDANFGPLPIAIYYSTDGGASFPFPSTITTTTQNDGSFTWTIPELDNASVQVRVVATDLAGHSSHDDSDADFAIDSTSPNGTLTIAEGDYTTVRDIHLILDAPADVAEMYLDGDLTAGSNVRQWVAFTTSTTVTLTAGDGSKTATVRYRDLAENEGDLASDATTFDATAPTITGQTPADGSTVTTGTPVISATLTDGTSGIDDTTISVTVDGGLAVHTYDPGSGMVSCTPSPALTNATHVVTISVQDQAGNPTFETWSFSVNEPPTSVLLAADPRSIVPDGISTATVTATVRSDSGHLVADGTSVVFTTTMGTLDGGTVYTTATHDGVATATLTASDTEGTATITATAGEAQGVTEVPITFLQFHIHLPLVLSMHSP